MTLYNYLADAVVAVHAAYIGFVLFGLFAILLGVLFHWKWVRNFWFRSIHLLAIGVVVVQALGDVICPLTTLEKYWREKGGGEVYCGSFVGHWVHELIFCEAEPWVFTVYYCLFGAVVLMTFILVPPRWPWAKAPHEDSVSATSEKPDG